MNYNKIYNSIIDNAKLRGLDKSKLEYYTECHHIQPKCLDGDDNPRNLVLLTAKEHYICHHLLFRMYRKHKGIIYAFMLFSNSKGGIKGNKYIPAKVFDSLKNAFSSIPIKFTQTHIDNISKGKMGIKLSEEHCKNISKSLIGNQFLRGHKHSDETKRLMSESHKGSHRTEEVKAIMRVANKKAASKANESRRDTCPYCNTSTTKSILTMDHGPNPTRKDPNKSNCRIKSLELGSSWSN